MYKLGKFSVSGVWPKVKAVLILKYWNEGKDFQEIFWANLQFYKLSCDHMHPAASAWMSSLLGRVQGDDNTHFESECAAMQSSVLRETGTVEFNLIKY